VKDGFYWARKLAKVYEFKQIGGQSPDSYSSVYGYGVSAKFLPKSIVKVERDEVCDFGSTVFCALDRYVFLSEALECDSREEAHID